MGNIIEWSVTVVFSILALILFSGKGAFLIAGYNTASKAEKEMYDEKKLCRVMGSGMGAIALLMAIVASFGYDKPTFIIWLLPIGIILIVVVMLILCNTVCKVKNTPNNYSLKEQESSLKEQESSLKSNKKILSGTVVFLVVTLIISFITLFTGNIKTSIHDKEIKIVASYWSDYDIELQSIKEIVLKEGINLGRRTYGMGSFKLSEGRFKNKEFGSYTLYSYNRCNTHIILDTTEGIIVINAETPEETKELYDKIVEAVNSNMS